MADLREGENVLPGTGRRLADEPATAPAVFAGRRRHQQHPGVVEELSLRWPDGTGMLRVAVLSAATGALGDDGVLHLDPGAVPGGRLF